MTADVGARIRSLRTARGLTQAQLAEPQYTKAYISMLESCRTRASVKALEHIAGRLGVQPSDLLGGSPSPAAPQYDLVESRRLVEQGDAGEAITLLDFFFQAEDGIRDVAVTGVQTCALPILPGAASMRSIRPLAAAAAKSI